MTSGLDRDRRVVLEKMPGNTFEATVGGTTGWYYTIVNEFSDQFIFFACYDGSSYQVMLIEPKLEGRLGAHESHLYSNGKLCLSDTADNGMPTLEQAYARSVVWSNGVSVILHDSTAFFPFSINNR